VKKKKTKKFQLSGKDWYKEDCGWVGAPFLFDPGILEKIMIQRRNDLEIIAVFVNKELSYEYEEIAIVLLENRYYIVTTDGCSCPSPSETWRVIGVFPSLLSIISFLKIDRNLRLSDTCRFGLIEELSNKVEGEKK